MIRGFEEAEAARERELQMYGKNHNAALKAEADRSYRSMMEERARLDRPPVAHAPQKFIELLLR